MKINAQKWHCHLFIWTWTFWHSSDDKNPTPVPKNTNLCQYFRYVTLFAAGAVIMSVTLIPLLYIVGLIKAFFLAIVFNWSHPQDMTIDGLWGDDNNQDDSRPYIPITHGRGWGLWLPIVLGLIIWQYAIHPSSIGIHVKYAGYGILAIIGVIIVAFIVYGIWKGFSAWRHTDAYMLFKAYLKARKEKVCPLITIEGLPSESDT